MFANGDITYRPVVQAMAGLSSIAREASRGLSPSAVPSGPNAAALAGTRAMLAVLACAEADVPP
jgi:hypothetical protein